MIRSFVFSALAIFCGCSAAHWGGDAAGSSPGVRVTAGNVWYPAEIQVTADIEASLDEFTYDQAGGLRMVNAKFGQDATTVTTAQPAKIQAIADLQEVQVRYVGEMWRGIVGVVAEIAPVLRLLAEAGMVPTDTGYSLTLPSGIQVGRHTITSGVDLQALLGNAAAALEKLATTPAPEVQP